MQGKQPYNAPRVHVRALARLQQLHEEISSGRCSSIQDLAVSTGRTSRTIKRDVKALRGDFKAPLVYDRQRKGFRYAAPDGNCRQHVLVKANCWRSLPPIMSCTR